MINIRPSLKGALCLVSTLLSGRVSAVGKPYGPLPQADTQPDTHVDTRPHTPFSVGLIYMHLIDLFDSQGLRMEYCGLGQ